MRKRVKFVKKGDIRFISHLDIMRFLNRAIRRANIPVEYTQGFNPQPKVSIALPLTLGYTSDAEYMDIDIDESKLTDQKGICIKNKLNPFMPEGMKIIAEKEVDTKESLMAMIKYAKYMVEFYDIPNGNLNEVLSNDIKLLLNKNEIMIEKHAKKGKKNIDILKDIIYIEVIDDGFTCLVRAGSENNLNPELIVKALNIYGNAKYDIKIINRLDVYDQNMNTPL